MQAQVLSAADARCDASRSMRGLPPPHPSRRAHARPDLRQRFRTRAPQDEAAQGIPNSRFVAEPFSVIPISRCQTALLVPAAHFCARGLQLRFTNPESRGGRSAERRAGARRNTREGAVSRHARRLRGALRPMTRDARLSALHRGGFGPRGRASVSLGARRPTTAGSCLRIRAASSSQPGRSAWRAGSRASRGERLQSRPPQDATPRSAFRMSPETPLKERGCDSDSIGTLRSQ